MRAKGSPRPLVNAKDENTRNKMVIGERKVSLGSANDNDS